MDFPNQFGVFTRLGSWVSWPVKRAIHENGSPPHHPCITSMGFNKSKTLKTVQVRTRVCWPLAVDYHYISQVRQNHKPINYAIIKPSLIHSNLFT